MATSTLDGNITREMNETFISTFPIGVVDFFSAINIFLSITASLGNALILVALHKETSLHPPTKLLFRCLAITDLCIGVISQPLFVVLHLLSVSTGRNLKLIFYIDKLYKASSFVLRQVSIFTSSAISVDRLQALLSGLRYRHVVTLPRVRAVIACFWLFGVSSGSIFFWKTRIAFTVFCAVVLFSLATSVFSYSKIYVKLRQHHLRVFPRGQPNGRQFRLNIVGYKNSLSSILWVQLAQVTCYVPFLVVVVLRTYGRMFGDNFHVAFDITATLIHLNSSLNPILYCWRIRNLRKAAKDTIKQLNCSKSD